MADVKVHERKGPCPCCGGAGRSVGAMHYEETQVWDKSGTFSGGGVVLTTGGPGIAIGGGAYHETGTSATKRAATFSEPEPTRLPFTSILVVGGLMAISIRAAPTFLEMIAPERSERTMPAINTPTLGDALAGLQDLTMPMMVVLIPICAGLALWMAYRKAMENKALEERINATEYPKKLARYNQLRYCGSCHVLYDRQGNARDANPVGFAQLMEMSS